MKCAVLMLLMLISLKETKCQSFCGELQLVDGMANCSGNELGSVCLFSCGEGFSIRGENRSLCEIDGDFAIWNPPVPQCSDRDECLHTGENNCSETARCQNTYGSYQCVCENGYTGNGFTCSDLDECQNSSTCHELANCSNSIGSYSCLCRNGFNGNGRNCVNINECLERNICGDNSTCVNANGSFLCSCNTGFTKRNVTVFPPKCVDIDECKSLDLNDCDQRAICVNTQGSYHCKCIPGYEGNGKTCSQISKCLIPGFTICDKNADCLDTNDSHACVCKDGFEGNGTSCFDVDECKNETHRCDPNAICRNSEGNYSCSCLSGFTGDGFNCQDKNECNDPTHSQCSAYARCLNTVGNYTCVCDEGYEGDGITCNDVNECRNASLRNCSKFADCVNVLGGFRCKCRRGFGGNGKSCFDVDECKRASTNNCHDNATCLNTLGSYKCSCKPGFGGNGTLCFKMDWCSMETFASTCHPKATCTNVNVTFECSCNEGYAGNGTFCTNINECASGTDRCHPFAICTDTDGSYTCECNSRFYGDGFRCITKPRLTPRIINLDQSCISVVFDPSRSYGRYKVVLEDGRRSIVRNFPYATGSICGLNSGTTYRLSAAATALRNGTEIKDPLYSDPITATTRYPRVCMSVRMTRERYLLNYRNLRSSASQRLMSRYRELLYQQITRRRPRYRYHYAFFRPRFVGFRRGSVIASIEAGVNITDVTPELLNEVFRNSPNFSEPTLLNKPTTSVSIDVINVTETSAMIICNVIKNSTSYNVQVMCDDEATVRQISSDEARLLIDGLKPNHVCSVRARALIAISNSAVAFTNFSDEAIFTTFPTIVNYKLESTDTSITLSFNRINGVDSFNVTIAPSKGSYHYVMDEEKDTVKKTIDGLEHNTSYTVTLEMVSVNHYGKPLPPISEISVVRTKVSPSPGLWWIALVVIGVILVVVAVIVCLKIQQLNSHLFKRNQSKSKKPNDVTNDVTAETAT